MIEKTICSEDWWGWPNNSKNNTTKLSRTNQSWQSISRSSKGRSRKWWRNIAKISNIYCKIWAPPSSTASRNNGASFATKERAKTANSFICHTSTKGTLWRALFAGTSYRRRRTSKHASTVSTLNALWASSGVKIIWALSVLSAIAHATVFCRSSTNYKTKNWIRCVNKA